ncbi:TPA: DUF3226 domain-containing protein [Vibrio parahaemolyticus]|uniref:DUF3226 domain-containing protein n=1 Tax=Vibrio parahaemolyticus TaxID=670 RepID=UPI00044A73B8|nr:DUF3226 domain-containing protein [Vibrio parahaemolyticus]EJG1281194.1 hypothetical protein [Vibrio parahaemolyticus]ELA8369632.1 hypothetical protein [Vibrio parahaemolyticus]EXJ42559.1 hypothetical protein D047_4031 [Vibrio parahaemolyticus VPTS-2010_2]
MDKICIVFCEGQHDIAFVSRILKVHDYIGYDKKIKDFIKPFDSLFMKLLEEKKVSDKKLGFASDYRVPSVSLCRRDERLVFFHNMGGDGKATERSKLIDMYKSLIGDDDFSSEFNLSIRFVFMFDADDVGIETRINSINQELGFDNVVKNGQLVVHDGFEWGAYIFHKEDETIGDLEDILLGIAQKTEDIVITNSEQFLQTNNIGEERQKEFVCTTATREYKAANKYKHKKSILSVAGQLQFSGSSNAVFISNSDFLSYEELTNNTHCQLIASLFR